MNTTEQIIDLGSITVPTSWREVTLEQFTKIAELDNDDASADAEERLQQIISILTNKDIDFIRELPYDYIEMIMYHLSFLDEQPATDSNKATEASSAVKSSITINGTTYTINTNEKLKWGEYSDVNMVLKNSPYDYSSILGILARKDGEEYNLKYQNEVLPGRIEWWKRQSIEECMPLIGFFLTSLKQSIVLSHISSMLEEELNNTRNSTIALMKSGERKALPIHLRIATSLRLKWLDYNMRTMFSPTSPTRRKNTRWRSMKTFFRTRFGRTNKDKE